MALYVAGRKVKIRTGRKTETVNIYSSQDVHGDYDFRLRLQHPQVALAEVIRERAFDTVDALVRFLRTEYHAELEQVPQGWNAGASDAAATPQDPVRKRPDLVARTIESVRAHPVSATVILLCVGLIAVGSLTGALEQIISFVQRVLRLDP